MAGMWQLQEAKNKLSKVVDEAIHRGPQIITRHGVEVAVVLSLDEYRRLASSQEKLSDFFRHSPLSEVDIDLSRDMSSVREDFPL
ncbi:MAG TPA: type II toxin-antitoxin system Phd/YefM family antitoxin [Thermodesulfobacteriota bacterium]|nr:type II toxin-antitoxin system Phd/YefM family antitoxin [Thermodesulfobacteriota bacterium]